MEQQQSYSSTAASSAIRRLREAIMERKGSFPERANPLASSVAFWRAYDKALSRIQIRANFLLEQARTALIEIEPDWRLAGIHLPMAYGLLLKPDATNPEHVRWIRELGLDEQAMGEIAQTLDQWHGAPASVCGQADPERQRGQGLPAANAPSETVFWGGGWVENHSIRDYAKVIRVGLCALREEVETLMAEADPADPEFPRKENFWRAARTVCEAGIELGRRYADMARELAEETGSPEEKERLLLIAETCARVPAQGARTFFEATQALWLLHILTCGEDSINANSIGRLDQILLPYYQADVTAGRLTREQAVEIMEELACRMYLEYDVQAITLGGLDKDGRDAVNELSYVILDATREIDLIRDLSVRLHGQSPEPFVRKIAEMIARGGGIPFIFNDDCFVKALSDRGIALEDARDYAPIGCIELTIPGRANPHAVSGWFNALKCLELALFNGQDPASGNQVGPKTGRFEDFNSFDDVHAAYSKQVEFFARNLVYFCNRGELLQRERGPLPCWSLMTDDCIERGRDITDGGAIYNYHSICFMGTANVADSLAALKKLVFEEKLVAPADLLAALRSDFVGWEVVRQLLLNKAPKYGNDQPEVDALAHRVADEFILCMDAMYSPLAGRYVTHLFTFRLNLDFGRMVGATPDGRKAGEPLAYSLSAHQGRDLRGVTAMLNSLARLPHDRAAGASAAIIDLEPSMVRGEQGVELLAQLIKSAIKMGVGQLQWNITTIERLKLAQEDPQRYGNIAVRVAGYSQLFRLIDKPMQDHIIARTKHKR